MSGAASAAAGDPPAAITAEDESQLGHIVFVPSSPVLSASGTVIVQPAPSSKHGDAEESKEHEARPAHGRPPSLQIHKRAASSMAVPSSPQPSSSPSSALATPNSARSSLRNLWGRKKNAVSPSPRAPDSSAAEASPSPLTPSPAILHTEAAPASAREEKEQHEKQAVHLREASTAWSQTAGEQQQDGRKQGDGVQHGEHEDVQPFTSETLVEGDEDADNADSDKSQQAAVPAAVLLATEATEEKDENGAAVAAEQHTALEAVTSHEVAASIPLSSSVRPSVVTSSPAVSTPSSPASFDLFSDIVFPPPLALPADIVSLTQHLLDPASFTLDTSLLSDSDPSVIRMEQPSADELAAAALERERLRLEAVQAELREWKEREWRVWKEEERVRKVVAAEETKRKEETSKTEQLVWQQQQPRVDAELRALHGQEQRLVHSLRALANITIVPVPLSSSPPSSSVPPSAPAAALSVPAASSSSVSAYPHFLHRYIAVYARTPRLLCLHVHALRAVRDKLGAGYYAIRVTVLDRLGGQPVRWSGSPGGAGGSGGRYSSQCSTREAQRHGGGCWEQELLFHQTINRLMIAAPSDADTRPAMVLQFELLSAEDPLLASSSSTPASAASPSSSSSSAAIAWGAFPLSFFSSTGGSSSSSAQSTLVSGHHRLPLLLGPVDRSVTTWRQLHRRLSLDLSSWLCNLYFHAERGEDSVDDDSQYCVELAVIKRKRDDQGQPDNGAVAELKVDDVVGSGEEESSAAALTSKLRYMDMKHAALVRSVRLRDGVAKEDINDPYAVWPDKDEDGWRRLDLGDAMDVAWNKAGWADHTSRDLGVELRTRKKKRKTTVDPAQLQAASSAYLFAVDSPNVTPSSTSPARSVRPSLLRVKLLWLLYHLDTYYHLSHPLSVPCLVLVSTFIVTLWLRLFVHYFGQWVYLASVMPSVSIDCSAFSCSFGYPLPLSTGESLLFSIIGTVIPTVLLLLVTGGVMAYHKLTRRSAPLLLHTALLCWWACLVLDPVVVDSSSLYHAGSFMSTLLAAFLSVTSSLFCLLVLCLFVMHVHAEATLLDTVTRLHAPDVLYVPNDYELCMREVLAVLDDSRQWRGDMGERRRVRVKVVDRGAGSAAVGAGGNAEVAREQGRTVYLSVVKVDAEDELVQLYRQFALLSNGNVFELFDSRDLTAPDAVVRTASMSSASASSASSDVVSAAAADAYLTSLLKGGRRKVADRSAAVLWAKVREHFGFTAERGWGAGGRGSFVRVPSNVRTSTLALGFGGQKTTLGRLGTTVMGARGRGQAAAARLGTFGVA